MIRTAIRTSLIAAAVLAASATGAQMLIPDPARTVVVDQKFHYVDLMRLAVPGQIHDGEDYRTGKPLVLRHISGDDEQRVEMAAGTPVRSPRAVLAQSEGRRRVIMMLDLGRAEASGEGVALLALFDVEPEPKLLDVVNVGYDRETTFFDPAKLTLSDASTPLLIRSGHWTSNQSYQTYVMVDLHGDRFHLIDTFFLLSDNGCGFERTQRPRFAVTGAAKKTAIQVTVTEITTRRKESCGGQPLPRAGKRNITVTYTWDPGRRQYVRSSDALDRLAKEMDDRL